MFSSIFNQYGKIINNYFGPVFRKSDATMSSLYVVFFSLVFGLNNGTSARFFTDVNLNL